MFFTLFSLKSCLFIFLWNKVRKTNLGRCCNSVTYIVDYAGYYILRTFALITSVKIVHLGSRYKIRNQYKTKNSTKTDKYYFIRKKGKLLALHASDSSEHQSLGTSYCVRSPVKAIPPCIVACGGYLPNSPAKRHQWRRILLIGDVLGD